MTQLDGDGAPVSYMERTRRYYRALGYTTDYIWAHFDDVPFTRLGKPLAKARLGLVTTAGPPDRSNRDEQGRRQVWSGAVDRPPVVFDTDVAWDRESTHVDDRETFLPIDAASRLLKAERIGSISPRFYGAATDYSHRKTIERDAPEIARLMREDGVDVALLTAL
jgi:hypothetical protein